MQENFENFEKSKKAVILRKKMGEILKKTRIEKGFLSLNMFALENNINRANLSKIENGEVGCSILTAWRISEALGLKLSDLIKKVETEVGSNITFIDT